jgi:hypothetical protein
MSQPTTSTAPTASRWQIMLDDGWFFAPPCMAAAAVDRGIPVRLV